MKYLKRLMAALLVLAVALYAFPLAGLTVFADETEKTPMDLPAAEQSQLLTEPAADAEEEPVPEPVLLVPEESELTPPAEYTQQELLNMYVEHIFAPKDQPQKPVPYSAQGPTHLKGPMLALYNTVVEQLGRVSAQGGSTKIGLSADHPYPQRLIGLSTLAPQNGRSPWSERFLEDISTVYDHIVTDHPEYLYWFGYSRSISRISNCVDGTPEQNFDLNGATGIVVYLAFKVAPDYQQDGQPFVVEATKILTAMQAKANADEIAKQIRENPALDVDGKLNAIKDKICALTSYNHDAAEQTNPANKDPWQMVWVFDDLQDPNSTKVVCEGYSKAFEYLCQKVFLQEEVQCYCVSGVTSGPHMWNVVRKEGASYLADLTACDASDWGPFIGLFLDWSDGMSVVLVML